MADYQNPKNSPPPSSSSNSRVPTYPNHNANTTAQKHHYPNPPETGYTGRSNGHYPNPPDPINPDAATLREQWRYAMRQYSRWYSQAWGSAILAGMAFFALGWIIKGDNPLPSFGNKNNNKKGEDEGSVPATLTSSHRDAVDKPKS